MKRQFIRISGVLFFVLAVLLMIAGCDEETDAEYSPAYTGAMRPRGQTDVAEEAQEPVSATGAFNDHIEAVSVGTDAKSATIMIYMNGSDLETMDGQATCDIAEMLSSGIGDHVNVILQTMGTREWQDYGISGQTAQTWRIRDRALTLIRDDLGQLACTSSGTLSEFIGFCKKTYPAERYLFLFWDHGGGPVYGFGQDEWQDPEESLTLAEISGAFSEHPDIHFDIIGMDCCIMASLETCYALAPYCKYTLLSEDFESGLGWSYRGWMRRFEENPGMSTPLLGKEIIDSAIEANESSPDGDSACLSLFNESTAKNLFTAWMKYAYKNEDALLGKNYSRKHRARGRGRIHLFEDLWESDQSNVTLSDYYISDILALVENIDNSSDEARNLTSTLKAAVAYYGHTEDKNELTGLAVSLPYGDPDFYEELKSVFTDIDIDSEYIRWLHHFVSDSSHDNYCDYGGFESSWGGWGDYESEYGCNLSNGSCAYGYDYDSGDYFTDWDGDICDDWIYDYEEDIWYQYDEDDMLYLYDEESDILCYYDEEEDEIYCYDEEEDDWIPLDE